MSLAQLQPQLVSFYFCVVSMTAMWTLMPLFCFNFNLISNSFFVTSFFIYIFLLNNFILSYSVLCRWLQCQHSCQYFIWTLILFLISFSVSVTSFSISIFLFNNFIFYYFCCCVDDCNVDTHAIILFWL